MRRYIRYNPSGDTLEKYETEYTLLELIKHLGISDEPRYEDFERAQFIYHESRRQLEWTSADANNETYHYGFWIHSPTGDIWTWGLSRSDTASLFYTSLLRYTYSVEFCHALTTSMFRSVSDVSLGPSPVSWHEAMRVHMVCVSNLTFPNPLVEGLHFMFYPQEGEDVKGKAPRKPFVVDEYEEEYFNPILRLDVVRKLANKCFDLDIKELKPFTGPKFSRDVVVGDTGDGSLVFAKATKNNSYTTEEYLRGVVIKTLVYFMTGDIRKVPWKKV